jgi:hypothetical protein
MDERLVIYIDKTMLSVKGVSIKGLRPKDLEEKIKKIVRRPVRIIGVTGSDLQMDIYGLSAQQVLMDENKIIKAVSLVEGIEAREIITLEAKQEVTKIDASELRADSYKGCARERWMRIKDEA